MSQEADAAPSRAVALRHFSSFDRCHDVVVVGHGAAGGAAAIEAARAGADTLVLERMSRGGGTTALSTGLTYLGGGTAIQRACGFDDSPESMQRYVTLPPAGTRTLSASASIARAASTTSSGSGLWESSTKSRSTKTR